MKPPDDPLLSLVRQWAAKAEIDYQTAERLLKDDDPIRESVAFHSQQAAEKYLKAFLVLRRIEFPKTHSIAQLLDLVASVDMALADSLTDTVALTPFGVQIRYPWGFPGVVVRTGENNVPSRDTHP
ncbi:MAG: HEPN domain-containing protein [Acidobacteriia bacterium]|nr:HEPN domain-containing protein [Terriglobia bacterium]